MTAENRATQQLQKVWSAVCRWKKTSISLCVILFIWLFGGGVILPYAVRHALEATWAKQTGQPVTVGAVRFNPWHWSLAVEQCRVTEPDGTLLLAFDRFFIDYDMLSLFRLEYGLDAIELAGLHVRVATDKHGGYNVQALAVPSEKTADTDDAPVTIPGVLVRKLLITDGVVDYVDAQRATPFEHSVSLANISVQDFHTTALSHGNQLAVLLQDQQDGRIEWTGTVRVSPLQVDGRLVIGNLDLVPGLDFAMPQRAFVLRDAKLDVDLPHRVALNAEGKLDVQVHDAAVGLRDIHVAAKGQDGNVIDLPAIKAEGITADVLQQRVVVGAVNLDQGKIRVAREADGSIDLQRLFAGEPAPESATAPVPVSESVSAPTSVPVSESAPAPAPAPTQAWSVEVKQLAMKDYGIHVTDKQLPTPVEMDIAPINVLLTGVRPGTAEATGIDVSVGLPSSGVLKLQGQAVLSPVSFNGTVQLQQLALPLAQPYIAQQAKLVLEQGVLGADFTVTAKQEASLALTVSGSANIRDLDVREKQQGRKLLSWHALDIQGISFALLDNALQVESVTVSKPYSRFIINADGSTNVQQLSVQDVKQTPAPTATKAEPATDKAAAPFRMAVKKVIVQDGDLGFADMTLKPHFRVAIERLNGSILDIDNTTAAMSKVDLKGKVDRYAPVSIKGQFNVLGEKPVLDVGVSFKNIELTTFTPYSGTYAGFAIDKGQLSLDVDYKLNQGKIQGKNKIVMNQLQLGKKVENDKAMDLPIRLALALLRDENGVIDLGFEVEGDMEEPSFSVGGLLFKVLGNVVKKAVSAPFSLVSGLLGGEQEQPDTIAFAIGDATLDETGKQKVDALAGLLQKRSMLQVNVRGQVMPDQDRLVLQQQKLARRLVGETGLTVEQFLVPEQAVASGKPRRLVGRLLHDTRHEELADVEARLREDLLAKQQTASSDAVRAMAYQQAWLRLSEAEPVADNELRQLGLSRAGQVKDRLMEQHGIVPSRIFVQDTVLNQDDAPAAAAVQLELQAE